MDEYTTLEQAYRNGYEAGMREAIPISLIKQEIVGINAAEQCDQAGLYDRELRLALETVLIWYHSPRYQERKRRTTP